MDRRQSAPARVGPSYVPKKTRTNDCGLWDCGWVTSTPGVKCTKCPGGGTHSAGEKLCSACHRLPGNQAFKHFRHDRLRRANQLVVELRATGCELPDALVNDFCPSNSCLCTRADCFHTFLMGVEKSKATRVCHDCGGAYSGKKARWLSLVHFILWSEKYWGRTFHKWLVTSVDTDEWMIILLAMSTGKIKAWSRSGAGDSPEDCGRCAKVPVGQQGVRQDW
ncbi:unnamed protein product [Pylaiella littoralis]